MSDDVELHPIVAALAATMARSPDKTQVAFPPEALERARGQVRASVDDDVVPHLIALAVKIRRVAGDGGLPAIAAIGVLVLEKLGSVDEVADRFAAAGMADAAALIGASTTTTAPREQPKATPAVKPKRGLSK